MQKLEKEQVNKKPNWVKIALISIAIYAVIAIAASLFMRNFYKLLAFDQTFSSIFEQISSPNTKVYTSLFVLVFIIPTVYWLRALWKKNAKAVAAIIGIAAFVLLFLVSVLLTFVNGVMFLDVVTTLVPLLSSGVL